MIIFNLNQFPTYPPQIRNRSHKEQNLIFPQAIRCFFTHCKVEFQSLLC